MNENFFTQLLLIIFTFLLSLSSANANDRKLVIDHDGGTDDVTAVFIALLYEKHFNGPNVVALTTVYGNTDEEYAYYNSQRLLKIAERQDVPIYRGAAKSTVVGNTNAFRYFGYDGLGEVPENYTDLFPAKRMHAVNALIGLSKLYEGKLSVVAIGPATNIALAISLDPDFLSRLEHFYTGDGYFYSEAFPDPGYNLAQDAEAYYTVMENATPEKVTILPFSQVQLYMNISWGWREDVFGTIDSNIVRTLNRYEAYTLRKEPSWHNLDPAVVAQFLDPTIVSEYRHYNHSIILCGEYRGINTNEQVTVAEANVRMIYSGDREKYKQFLYDLFSSDDTSINVILSDIALSKASSSDIGSSIVKSFDAASPETLSVNALSEVSSTNVTTSDTLSEFALSDVIFLNVSSSDVSSSDVSKSSVISSHVTPSSVTKSDVTSTSSDVASSDVAGVTPSSVVR